MSAKANNYSAWARERRDWIYVTTVLLRYLAELRERGKISRDEYERVTMLALPDCDWGSR